MATPQIAAQHLAICARDFATGQRLEAVGDPWAAVAYFYSTYRVVRAAMYADERLNSDSAARAVSPKLNAGSRHVDFHNGHPARGPGVNDIVRLLYPPIGARYELLHTKSVEVRYGAGLTAGTIADTRGLAEDIRAYLRGEGRVP